MAKLKQYLDTVTLTEREVDDLAEAMEAVLKDGIKGLNSNRLATNLSLGTTLAGIIFNITRKKSIALGVVGLALSLSTSEKDDLEYNIQLGIDDLHDTRRFMRDNGYTKAKIEFPFMDYEDMRLVTGKGYILRLRDENGRWETQ